jgi:hypothetical protein
MTSSISFRLSMTLYGFTECKINEWMNELLALTYLLANQLSGRFEHKEFYRVCLSFGISFVCLENTMVSLCIVTPFTIVLIREAFNLLSGFKLWGCHGTVVSYLDLILLQLQWPVLWTQQQCSGGITLFSHNHGLVFIRLQVENTVWSGT